MIRSAVRTGFVAAWAVAWLGLAGCSSKPPPKQEDPVEIYLRRIVQAYDVAEYRLGRFPRTEDELKRFLPETGATEAPEQLLRSPRDGQPYVIVYGAALDPNGYGTILAYEKVGVEGQRYVITVSRDVKVMAEAEFARADFARGHKPSKAK
jgi:hypothetical protein